MSHWTTVKTEFKSLTHLEAAAQELGLKMEVAQVGKSVTAIGYSGNKRECHAKISGKRFQYDIAIDKNADGTFGLTTDWYDGKEKIVGKDFMLLKQHYSVNTAMSAIKAKGWTASKRVLKDGTIQLVASGM